MTAPQTFRGEQLGLPEGGRGSLAPTGARLLAFLVDAFASGSRRRAVRPPPRGTLADRLPGSWSLIPFAVDYVVGTLVAGRTIGMYLTGLRLVRVSRQVAVDPLRAIGRDSAAVPARPRRHLRPGRTGFARSAD